MNTLHAATVTLLSTLELDVLLDLALTAALRAVPTAEGGILFLVDETSGKLQVRAVKGHTDARVAPLVPMQVPGYIVRAVRERSPILVEDTQSDPNLAYQGDIRELQEIASCLVAPLLLGEQVLGVLLLESSEQDVFAPSDLRLLAAFAATAGVAIRNAQVHAEVQRQAITDHLTGLYNRRGLADLGQREIERAKRFKHPLSAILMDLDHFKQVNDTYGHAVGDMVIYTTAQRCRKNIRHIDVIARYGGEEFVVLLPETDMPTLYRVAERLREAMAESPVETERGPVYVTVSLGVTMATEDTLDLMTLINRADEALYVAKQMGGNQLVVR
ncbi:MAG: sensor domain-containing diguanylate cyclase [Chloroflexi bacterium]|nr:sensor domain-containing diguanylate cyclase [Chloroflexota bacterium]